jgi:hypothetical protein
VRVDPNQTRALPERARREQVQPVRAPLVRALARWDPVSAPPAPEVEDRPLARTQLVRESANQATKEMRASCVSFSLCERPRGFITDCSIVETTRDFLDDLSFFDFLK